MLIQTRHAVARVARPAISLQINAVVAITRNFESLFR